MCIWSQNGGEHLHYHTKISLQEWLDPKDIIAAGTLEDGNRFGITFHAKMKSLNSSTDVVVKMQLLEDDEEIPCGFLSEYKIHSLLSTLGHRCRNFVPLYGGFIAPYGALVSQKQKENINVGYLVMEPVRGYTSRVEIIAFYKTVCPYDYLTIVLQVMFALGIAQDEFSFTHFDLSRYNVLIEKCDSPTPIEYTLHNVTKVLVCNYRAVIIDFGSSRLESHGKVYRNQKISYQTISDSEFSYQSDSSGLDRVCDVEKPCRAQVNNGDEVYTSSLKADNNNPFIPKTSTSHSLTSSSLSIDDARSFVSMEDDGQSATSRIESEHGGVPRSSHYYDMGITQQFREDYDLIQFLVDTSVVLKNDTTYELYRQIREFMCENTDTQSRNIWYHEWFKNNGRIPAFSHTSLTPLKIIMFIYDQLGYENMTP